MAFSTLLTSYEIKLTRQFFFLLTLVLLHHHLCFYYYCLILYYLFGHYNMLFINMVIIYTLSLSINPSFIRLYSCNIIILFHIIQVFTSISIISLTVLSILCIQLQLVLLSPIPLYYVYYIVKITTSK